MKKIKKSEYLALRDEMNSRIQIMNTHNLGMITAVFAAWAIVGVLINDYLEICSDNLTALMLYSVLIPFLLVMPIGIIMPLAVKSGDNFGQIMSLSGYLKLYAEMPSILGEDDKFIGWESLQKKEIERKFSDKFFNCEYFILSIMSLCIFIAVAVIFCIYGFNENRSAMWYMLSYYIFMAVLGTIGIIFISRKSSVSRFLKKRNDYYERYCKSAIDMGFVTMEELEKYNKIIRGGNMNKYNGLMNYEIVMKLREMMCSGKEYNPITWRYCDGDVNPCGNVDCSAIMSEYQVACRKSMEKYNVLPLASKFDKKRQTLLSEIFGESDCFRRIEAPFHANYGGKHTMLRGMFYAGFNLTLIEDGQIEIGDKTMIGPNVTLCTAEHPTDIAIRAKGQGILYNKKITIGSNVWIGANVTILAGATIGDNCIIGANSVITKNTVIPNNKIAVGVVTTKNVSALKSIS